MNAKKILLATDFSAASNTALEYAEMLARDSGGSLLIVHVQEPVVAYNFNDMQLPPVMPEDEQLEDQLKQVVPCDRKIAFEHRLVQGMPAEVIVGLAQKENASLIVMGTHGRTGLTRLLMGSVAESVVRRAPCPVLTIRQRAQSEPASDTAQGGAVRTTAAQV